MRRVTILQPSYIPWIGYFDQINKSDVFIFFDDVLYTKNDWRNRNRIKSPQGPLWVTIPVNTKNRISGKMLVKDARISDKERTYDLHMKMINANYRRANYFDEVSVLLEKVLEMDTDNLCEFTIKSTKLISLYLGITDVEFYKSSELPIRSYDNPTDHLVKMCKLFNATNYLTGDSAKSYLEQESFKNNDIILEFHNYKHPVYNQLWGNFVPYLSIVDLLFNEGKKSLKVLSTT